MKQEQKKLLGEERRERLLSLLKESNTPITGGELAEMTRVSRQVIVGDINLLKARNIPIIATSQGYLYMKATQETPVFEKTIVCSHSRSQTAEELYILVDHGITVKNVIVEHPIYGDLTASLMVSNRKEVEHFLHKVKITNSSLLADLTSGIHLHALAAPNKKAIEKAEKELKAAGILVDEN
ncbi:transcription repressor NadR [Lederbergia sp. NSJ-179]|uniref:transcription repressor NadR n=1 Tax=Lederbergia sp. NSJ-179 TaxID=2931402 RepID=UPI001FD5B5DF|nr:transcription repressor NadR [Lederbergia sp. NSJ-179]MCJ7839913.1 transcription repressor NadR [Lederbergia sp. NSJ-179]